MAAAAHAVVRSTASANHGFQRRPICAIGLFESSKMNLQYTCIILSAYAKCLTSFETHWYLIRLTRRNPNVLLASGPLSNASL